MAYLISGEPSHPIVSVTIMSSGFLLAVSFCSLLPSVTSLSPEVNSEADSGKERVPLSSRLCLFGFGICFFPLPHYTNYIVTRKTFDQMVSNWMRFHSPLPLTQSRRPQRCSTLEIFLIMYVCKCLSCAWERTLVCACSS